MAPTAFGTPVVRGVEVDRAVALGADFIVVNQFRTYANFVTYARHQGLDVIVWGARHGNDGIYEMRNLGVWGFLSRHGWHVATVWSAP